MKRQASPKKQLAEKLAITQGAVSAYERSTDPKLSTLRRHVEALGATLKIEIVIADSPAVI